MIEYIYDVIRCSAGQDADIVARITDDNNNDITEDCYLMLHLGFAEDSEANVLVAGEYMETDGEWHFIIPAEASANLSGRYEYCIQHAGVSLCFKKPIYFVG